MNKIAIILYWLSKLLLKNNNLTCKEKIKETNLKLIVSFKYFSIKSMIRNNFDIKPIILKLFFISFLINSLLLAITILINTFYTSIFFYNFIGCKISEVDLNWNWVITLIINILIIDYIIRFIGDSLKLSLRGSYRNNYLKLLVLDIFTLNILSIIGTLIFIKNKEQILKINDDYKICNSNLNSKITNDYFKLIIKIEVLILFFCLIFFSLALISGYFINNNTIKLICWAIIILIMTLLYGWSLLRIIGSVILKKMSKNLLVNNSYYFLITIIRFLAFGFGYYHIAVLINILKIDENTKIFILENW